MTTSAPRRPRGSAQESTTSPPPLAFRPRQVEFGAPPPPRYKWPEVLAIIGCAVVLSVAMILLISGYFTGRDPALVAGTAFRLGQSYPDQGDGVLVPGMLRPAYDSQPPTSGPHIPAPVRHNASELSDDQLLTALAAGDVVVEYGARRPPAGLRELAARFAGPFSPALAAAGQAVVLARAPGTSGLIGLAWTRMVRATAPGDTLLRQFIEAWLGHGASSR